MKIQTMKSRFSRQTLLSGIIPRGRRHRYRRYLGIIPLLLLHYAAIAEDKKFLTLNTTTKPPLSTPEQQGFLDQVAQNALSRFGIKVEILSLPAERALRDANAGVLDGELARVPGIEKTYSNLLFIPESLMDVEFTVFSIRHESVEPGWDGLKGHSVAFLNGWKILEKNVPGSAEITKVNSPSQLFNLLKLNRVDYIIYEKWGGIALAKSLKIDNVNVLSPPLAVRQLHMYLHNKHADLAGPLAEVLKQIKSDGTYQEIFKNTLEPFATKP